MHVDGILESLRELNAAQPTAAKPKKKNQTVKVNGGTMLSPDEALRINVARVVAAFGLEAKGVTVEQVVTAVRNYEAPYEGAVQ